jgi:chemotaxis protein MotB
MKPRKRTKQELWLMSFTDIMTNLLGFMILILSFSKVDQNRFDSISKEMTRKRTDSLDQLKAKLESQIQEKNLEKAVTVDLDLSGLHIEFEGSVLFETGQADLNESAQAQASPILNLLVDIDPKYIISLEGHTDDLALQGGTYKNNWILSSARGTALLMLLEKLGVEHERMKVSGYADTRPKVPLDGLDGEELREARRQNRRVVIRVFQ